MDLINWSLNATDTIFSTRSAGSGEPDCPAGTYAAGYRMDGWEKWRVVCLAALSVEDIEDIYLFGTMITGLMVIGLGIALTYRKLKKTVTAAQSPTRLAGMIDGLGRAVGAQTMAIDRKLDNITVSNDRRFDYITVTMDRRLDNITERLMALQRILDGGDQHGH